MAETYKGLTIRIGGDTSGLTRALKNTSSAISKTQQQLRLLSNAAKLDPENTQLAVTKMGLLANKAQDARVKVNILSEQMRQLGNTDVGGKTVAQLAAQTENANLKAADALNNYNRIDGQLENIYIKIKEISGVDLTDKSAVSDIDQALLSMKGISPELDKIIANAQELRVKWHEAFDENESATKVKQFENLRVQIKAVEAETIALNREWAAMAMANPFIKQTEASQRFRESINQINAATRTLKTEYSTLDEALRLDPSNLDAARMKMQNLQEQVKTGAQKMQELRTRINELESAGVGEVSNKFKNLALETERCKEEAAQYKTKLEAVEMALNEMANSNPAARQTDDWNKLEAEATQFREKLQQVQVRMDELGAAGALRNLKAELVGVSAATQAAATEMTTLSTKASGVGGAFQQLGWAMYSTVTPAMMMFGYSAINAAEQIDTAYRDMRKTVQGTEEQFEGLKQAAIDYSRTHVTTADQILEIEAMGGQLGIATSNLEGFAVAVSNIDIATDLDCDTASQQLGQLAGILNDMTENDFTKYADALVRLGNNNATLESHISNVMLRIASMGTITGFTTPQLLAWSTAVAATGQGAEAAGTAVSKTISDIEGAVGEGGDALQAFADVAQMSSEDFASAWNNDPSGAMYAFINGLKDIEANGGSADNTLGELGITSVRQKQTIMGLMQTIDGLNDSMTMSNDAWDGVSDEWGQAGDAANEADKKTAGFSGAIQLLRNNFQDLGVEMGESIAPILTTVGDLIGQMTQAFSDFDQPTKQAIMGLVGIAAAIGPVSVATNAVVQAFKAVAASQVAKGTAWAKAISESKRFNGSLIDMASASVGVSKGGEEAEKAIKGMSTKSKVGAAALGALKNAAVLAGIALAGMAASFVIDQLVQYKKYCDDLNESTLGLRGATDRLVDSSTSLSGGIASAGQNLIDYKDKVDKATESQLAFKDSIEEKTDKLESDNFVIADAMATIEKWAGKTEGNKAAQDELATAVENVNRITGSTYSIVDETTGALSASTEEIKKNSEAWEINAKKQALQELAVAAVKDIYEQTKAYNSAQHAADSWRQVEQDIEDQYHSGAITAEEYTQRINEIQPSLDAAAKAEEDQKSRLDEAQNSYSEIREEVNDTTDAYNRSVPAIKDVISSMEGLYGEEGGLTESLQNIGVNVDDFSLSLSKAQVSSSKLAKIAPDDFRYMLENCGGDINALVGMIAEYNQVPMLDKDGNVTAEYTTVRDANGEILIWNGSELKHIDGSAVADSTTVYQGNEEMGRWDGQKFEPKSSTATATGNAVDGSAQEHLEGTADAQDQIDPKVDSSVNVSGNYEGETDKIWNLVNALNSIPLVSNIGATILGIGNAAGGIRPHAAGGIVPRYHADGAIATRAMPLDIVGEAGAEAIVPLTNKRYSEPFARTLAEQMQSMNNNNGIDELTAEVRALKNSLGRTIAENAPVVKESEKDFNRRVRRAVNV